MEEEDFQEVILETVKKVFNFQCSAKVELKNSETYKEGEEWGGQGQTDVTSMTYLSAEDVNCSVGICFSKPSYLKYISAMFGEEVTEFDDQTTDASGEFLNMIMGNIKAKYYESNKKDKILCAKFRKGHFEGVLDVMNRLLSLIKAKHIFMGEKDFQQFFLVKKILGKKHKIKIISCPTIRDKNKIALSTRNSLLKYKSKKIVSSIALKLLRLKKNLISKNYKNKINLSRIKKEIEMNYKIKIDYLEFRDEKNLKLNDFKKKYRLFIAYTIDNVRLIDNF